MADALRSFERIVRASHRFSEADFLSPSHPHAFETRNLFPGLPKKVRELFDDGHYSESTFEAFKFIDKRVGHFGHLRESGFRLMMAAFDKNNPKVTLTPLREISEVDEQEGFKFLFAGSMLAIRNPRGHEFGLADDPDTCLDHLTLASLLLRRLQEAGYA